ncbi:transmembrane emp24 domain-containing protein p24delta9-like [Neltuma alba]|uniref:transmembrane emp24 domain-containing protein p24delta9 n=1 Tax=Neltuma alba TaxID=207710 RepID=UPI0010A4BCBD|nr:transmembrane emp24 domain-containing protein p24delta9-like [Prosopis alba]XP_028786642.1 transmembrane emp24 domain-containing protein p24delta9-like [Prosopis alba]
MIRSNLQAFLLLLVLGLFSPAIESLRFELQSGHTKCISEDIKSNSMTVGKYSIVNPNDGFPIPDSHKVTVRVTSSYGNNYHYADQVTTGQFAFVAVEAGDYMACFWAPDHNPQTTMTIDFDWRTGVAAKDWSNVAKKGHVDVMELELKKLYETVNSIHEEMYYLRAREEEMQELNSATNNKMFWLSLLSLFICLSVAGLHLWHLKTFFEKKKLI